MREGEVALLVVDLVGSTSLYEQLGDDLARRQIGECLRIFGQATELFEGRVVKSLGDGALCVFPAADSALLAAVAIRSATAERDFDVHAAIHTGPVVEDDDGDIFGDSVNTVSRLGDAATSKEILLSGPAREALSQGQRARLQPLPAIAVRGKRAPIEVFSMPAEQAGHSTVGPSEAPGTSDASRSRLVLTDGDHERTIGGSDDDRLRLGRDATSDFVVLGPRVSREHARIFRMGANFYLVDTSSNGTWLEPHDQPATRLHRERAPLIGRGAIHCGVDPTAADEAAVPPIRFRVEHTAE